MPNEHCIGCHTKMCCKFDGYNDKGQCPCTDCIVKMICEDMCNLFGDYKLYALNVIASEAESDAEYRRRNLNVL
jgi:hypothetical protein